MGSSVYAKYAKHHDFGGKRVLNLGCGFDTLDNAINLDLYDVCKPQVVCDLSKGKLPFEDGSFDFIIANHVMEHIEGWWAIFEECSRVLSDNGRLEVWVPGSGTDSIFGFRDHVNEINQCSFFGTFQTYRARGNAWAKVHSIGPANRLKVVDTASMLESYWWTRLAPRRLKAWYAKHLRNVVLECGYIFRKISEAEWQAAQ